MKKPNEGRKDDFGKIRITTLFEKPFANEIESVVKVLELGAKKYGDHNWKIVLDGDCGEDRYMNAFRRHWQEILKGKLIDEESGLSHYAHAIANLFFLFHKNNREV